MRAAVDAICPGSHGRSSFGLARVNSNATFILLWCDQNDVANHLSEALTAYEDVGGVAV
ncbi:MAG: hypothetical protein ACYSWW_20930 [Planctomycetota bacterium]|jgi:hypothetical protein